MKDIREVPTDRLGRVVKTDTGDTRVEFVRVMPYSADQVWHAITDADSLAKWFPGFQLEHRQGGTFAIWFGGDCSGPAHVSGIVDVYDPPKELRCGSMRWQLESISGGCQLTFTDILRFNQDHRSDYEISNSVLAGWHLYIDHLEESLAGTVDPNDDIEYDYSQIEVTGRPVTETATGQ